LVNVEEKMAEKVEGERKMFYLMMAIKWLKDAVK
jgi:hypothetical protein